MELSDDCTTDQPLWKFTFVGGMVDRQAAFASWQWRAKASDQTTGNRLLAMTSVGDRVEVVQILGGRGIARQLRAVGLVRGRQIAVISLTKNGSVIVSLHNGSIGLGAVMASQVIVKNVTLS